MVKKLAIFCMALTVAACSTVPGTHIKVSEEDQKKADAQETLALEQIEFKKITAQNTPKLPEKKRRPYRNFNLERRVKQHQYRVGAGDVLQIVVWEHPELLNLGTPEAAIPVEGFLVDQNGDIFYPQVGKFHVAGKSVIAIRAGLSAELGKYIKKPQLEVVVSNYNSQKIYLTGQFARPVPIPIQNKAITLLDAVNAAGGLNSAADPNDVVIVRKGARKHVDYHALMHYGDMRQNILLQDGDQVHVPRRKARFVYMMGQVLSTSPVQIGDEGLTLAEALGRSRGLNEASSNAAAIYVIRESNKKGKVVKVHQLDLSNMAAMVLASRFELKPQDVVYVAKSEIVKWNQFLSNINPSMSATTTVIDLKNKIQAELQ